MSNFNLITSMVRDFFVAKVFVLLEQSGVPNNELGRGKFYTKAGGRLYFQDGPGVEHIVPTSVDYGEMVLHDNAGAMTINDADEPHAISGLSTGLVSNFTFNAGETAAITVFADAGDGQVTVTSAGHGLSNGDWVTITGTTNYQGVFQVANVDTDTFEITDTWVADDGTGTYEKGSSLTAGAGAAGNYKAILSIIGSSAANAKAYNWHLYINGTISTKVHVDDLLNTTISGSAGSGLITLADDDVVWIAVEGSTDTSDLTHKTINLNLKRV